MRATFQVNSVGIYQGQWVKVACAKSDFVSLFSGVWADPMNAMAIKLASATGTQASFSIDDLRINYEALPRCVITFDDSYVDDIGGGETEHDYMIARGLKGTLYTIPNSIGLSGHLSLSQLKTLYSEGWAIANHTNDHDNWANSLITTQASYEAALKNCYDYLVNNDMPRAARHVAYPGGVWNANALAAMTSQGMLTGRTVVGYYQPTPMGNYHLINSRNPGTATTLATAKGWIDQAIAEQSTLFIGLHDIRDSGGSTNRWAIASFKGLIDYIGTRKIKCVTIDEWYNGLTNPRRLVKRTAA